MEYEEIIKAIQEAPLTYITAIMIKAIEEAKKRKVFVSDEVMKDVIARIIDRNG